MIQRGRAVHYSNELAVDFGLPSCLKGLKNGDRVELQVMYSPGGWENVGEGVAQHAIRLLDEGGTSRPLVSNRLEVRVTAAMIRKAE